MTNRTFGYLTLAFLLACLVSILLVDQPLAFVIADRLRAVQPFFRTFTHLAELASGFPVSKYLPGLILLIVGGIVYFVDKNSLRAKLFFFVALTFMLSRLTAGTLKNVFERVRPFDLLETGRFGQTFFVDGGSSFPSGHAAHFWGLFLPLMFLFPKYKIPFLIVPVLIGLGRVVVGDHYLSDVLASVYIAFFFTFILAKMMKVDLPHQPAPNNSLQRAAVSYLVTLRVRSSMWHSSVMPSSLSARSTPRSRR